MNLDDEDVAIVANPAESIRRRFEDMKMKMKIIMSKPFPGAFQQIKREWAFFKEQFETEKKILTEIEAEWNTLKRDIGVPFLQSLQMPVEFHEATNHALARFKEELRTFYSDRDTDEFRVMSAKLENLAFDAIAVGRSAEIEDLRADLEARGVPLLERLLHKMIKKERVEVIDLTETDDVGDEDMVSLINGHERPQTEDDVQAAKESFCKQIEDYIKPILCRLYEENPGKFLNPENEGKALFLNLTKKIYSVEVHNWELRRNRSSEQLILTDTMKIHIDKYIDKASKMKLNSEKK